METILIASRNGRDPDHVLGTIEESLVDDNRRCSLGAGVNEQPVDCAESFATFAENRRAEFDLHHRRLSYFRTS
jgi:hypothetical protein